MIDPNRELLESAADLLRPLLDELVFVGGCATGLLITDPGSGGVRATRDVDTATQVSSYAKYATLTERLRALGLTEDTEVICRWHHGELVIDVMPTDKDILGFTNYWYWPAVAMGNTPVAEMPFALYAPGPEPWSIQVSTSPLSFLISRYQRTCGLVHWTRVMTPTIVFGELLSNSA